MNELARDSRIDAINNDTVGFQQRDQINSQQLHIDSFKLNDDCFDRHSVSQWNGKNRDNGL